MTNTCSEQHIHTYRLQPNLNKILQNVYYGHFWVRTLLTFVHSFPLLCDSRKERALFADLKTMKESTTMTQWAPTLSVSHLSYHGTFSPLSTCDLIPFRYDIINSLKCRSGGIHSLWLQQLLISHQMRSSSCCLCLLLIFLQGCSSLELLDRFRHAPEL